MTKKELMQRLKALPDSALIKLDMAVGDINYGEEILNPRQIRVQVDALETTLFLCIEGPDGRYDYDDSEDSHR